MSNRISRIITALALTCGALSGAELSLGSATVEPGKTAVLELKMSGGNQDPAALQCDLVYDFNGMSIAVEPGAAARMAGKNVTVSQPEANTLRLVVAGLNRNAMSDGVVALVKVTARSTPVHAGDHSIHIANVLGSTKDVSAVLFASSDGHVRITPGHHPHARHAKEDRK